jgi:hypothetical protein
MRATPIIWSHLSANSVVTPYEMQGFEGPGIMPAARMALEFKKKTEVIQKGRTDALGRNPNRRTSSGV